MASPIKRKAVSSVQPVPSPITPDMPTQPHTSQPPKYAHGIPEEIYVAEKAPETGRTLTDQEDLLRLYSLSAAELEKFGPTELRNRSWHEISYNDVKDTQDKIKHTWNLFGGKSKAQVYYSHLKSQFGGGTGRKWPYVYTNPSKTLDQEDVDTYTGDLDDHGRNGKRPFLNPFGATIWKYEDVDTYLSPSNSVPRRLIVQATGAARKDHSSLSWRRTAIKGTVPLALRMAEWSLLPTLSRTKSFFRQALVALPLQALLALPGASAPWETTDVEEYYLDYPGYHWKWPKHAINPLDARMDDRKRYEKPERLSSKQRLYRPRQLVILRNEKWEPVENPPKDLQYIFISYHWGSFHEDEKKVDDLAQYMCKSAGLTAYFHDCKCNAKEEGALKTADVNRMCDVIRGSQFVAILLPDNQPQRKRDWGRRMWTLPEALLAPDKLQVCTWLGSDKYSVQVMGKVELTSQFWEKECEDSEVSGRVLAEHYEGVTILSRLELFSAAVSALEARTTDKDYTGADLAYALMGLLHYRIEPDPTDDLFQVIARLSLANDNDRLIERLISMFPKAIDNKEHFFKSFAESDQYDTHAWDIEPRCQVVGVGDEPNTVILSECRAVPIRWKRFPRMMYKRHQGLKKRLAELVIRSGAWWMVTGYGLAFTYGPIFLGWAEFAGSITDITDNVTFSGDKPHDQPHYERWLWATILLFICMGIILAIFAPKAVRRLFGGAVLQSAPHLVAFEGTMPLADLERMVFGSDAKRLRYEPSSTPFSQEFRHPYIRRGIEPDWIAKSEPRPALPGHRWFTLVDTGNLSVSVFQAKRPPTVAFITGAEGGMHRAVLCSWRFANDCHYRETVIRVPSNTWELCKPAAWVKVSLQSQDDLFATSNRPRRWTPNATPPSQPPEGSASPRPPKPPPSSPPPGVFASPRPAPTPPLPVSQPIKVVRTMTEKAHKTPTYVQTLNPAAQNYETGISMTPPAQQMEQRHPASPPKALPTPPNYDQRISMASATTHISSQAQSPVNAYQQWSPMPQPYFYTPEPNTYLTPPLPDLPYAELGDTHPTDAMPPPSLHERQSPEPEYPAPLYTLQAFSRPPVHEPAATFYHRPSLVSRYAENREYTIPDIPRVAEESDYGFMEQPLMGKGRGQE